MSLPCSFSILSSPLRQRCDLLLVHESAINYGSMCCIADFLPACCDHAVGISIIATIVLEACRLPAVDAIALPFC